jgi:hypothetical protein
MSEVYGKDWRERFIRQLAQREEENEVKERERVAKEQRKREEEAAPRMRDEVQARRGNEQREKLLEHKDQISSSAPQTRDSSSHHTSPPLPPFRRSRSRGRRRESFPYGPSSSHQEELERRYGALDTSPPHHYRHHHRHSSHHNSYDGERHTPARTRYRSRSRDR